MATTTNYGWTTPDDTALVKDGAAAIRTLGTSVDTTTKNLNPSTTLGDIEYRSSTANTNTRVGIGSSGQSLTVVAGVPSWAASATSVLTTTGDTLYASAANTLARLGIGSTGQVLSVVGGVPSWATVAGSGLTLITTGSFSGTSTSINNCFSSTYDNYLMLCETEIGITAASNLSFRYRVSGADNSQSKYNIQYFDINGGSLGQGNSAGDTEGRFGSLGTGAGSNGRFVVNIFNPYASKQKAIYASANRLGLGGSINAGMVWHGWDDPSYSFTGITLFASGSQTFTGTYYIYGLAK